MWTCPGIYWTSHCLLHEWHIPVICYSLCAIMPPESTRHYMAQGLETGTLELDCLDPNPSSATYYVVCARWALFSVLMLDCKSDIVRLQKTSDEVLPKSVPEVSWQEPTGGRRRRLGCLFPRLFICKVAMGQQCPCPEFTALCKGNWLPTCLLPPEWARFENKPSQVNCFHVSSLLCLDTDW